MGMIAIDPPSADRVIPLVELRDAFPPSGNDLKGHPSPPLRPNATVVVRVGSDPFRVNIKNVITGMIFRESPKSLKGRILIFKQTAPVLDRPLPGVERKEMKVRNVGTDRDTMEAVGDIV
jgi:hypothetical protein